MSYTTGTDRADGFIVEAALYNQFLGASGNINLSAPYLADAANQLFYGTGSKVITKLNKGTAYQYLTVNDAGNTPSWADSPAKLLDAKGELLSSSAANTPVAVSTSTDGYMLEARASESAGVRWVAASGGTTPAQMEFEPMMTCDTLFTNASFAQALTANRLYISPLQPVGLSTTIGDFVCSVTASSSNFILCLFSYNGTTFTKVGDDTGSTSVPSVANPAVLTGLDETMSVGTRYYYGVISDGTPSFRMKYDSNTSVNYAYYYDVGSFSIPSTVAKSAVTASFGNPVSGFFENGGLITDS